MGIVVQGGPIYLQPDIAREPQVFQTATFFKATLTALPEWFTVEAFKQVDDRYGHSAGDSVLQAYAERLKKAIRGSGLAACCGGDEFLALLPDCTAEVWQYFLKRRMTSKSR